jgi:hypothetical protein
VRLPRIHELRSLSPLRPHHNVGARNGKKLGTDLGVIVFQVKDGQII